jgi:hypothetical protein
MSTRAVSALSALIRGLKKALGRAEKAKQKVEVQVKKKARKAKKEVAEKTPDQIAAYQAALDNHARQVERLTRNVETVGKELEAAAQAKEEAVRRAEMYKPRGLNERGR